MTIPIQALTSLPDHPQGVVFWWSNILRAYQLRVYLSNVPFAPEIHLTREEVEAVAQALVTQHQLPIYEISIERLHQTLLDGQAQ